jgi:F-type H+-transporting ATPase subunit b
MFTVASIIDTANETLTSFGVDWPMFIAQAINFTLVALAIWFFAFKKILSTIKEREKQIADSLKNADKIKLELAETEKKQKETLDEASIQAKKTALIAKDQAKSFIESQKEEARKEAESIIAKAKKAMELERQNVLKDAREEIASLVIMTTTKVLSRDLSDDEKKRFTESAIASTSS